MKRKLPNLKYHTTYNNYIRFSSLDEGKLRYSTSMHSNKYSRNYITLYFNYNNDIVRIVIPNDISKCIFDIILYDKYNVHFTSKISKTTIKEIYKYFELSDIL